MPTTSSTAAIMPACALPERRATNAKAVRISANTAGRTQRLRSFRASKREKRRKVFASSLTGIVYSVLFMG